MIDVPIFEIEQLRHAYDGRPVLFVDALAISRGSITGLMGPNGSGKSTLLKLLAHTESPCSGTIRFNGRKEPLMSRAVRFNVTLLTQKPYLLKRSVFDNIAYGLKIRKDTREMDSRIREALELVGLDPALFLYRKWHQLSGGEAQRAALAARLILKPEVLLMDEPTASVDSDSAVLIRNAALHAKAHWGTTLIIASHDLNWLSNVSDTLLHLHGGHLFRSGVANIVNGPWTSSGDNHAFKCLSDGQHVIVPHPPTPEASAVIPHACLKLHQPDAHPASASLLRGSITSMTLEKKSGDILAAITIGEIQLTLKLTPGIIESQRLHPGKTVVLDLDPKAVTWIQTARQETSFS